MEVAQAIAHTLAQLIDQDMEQGLNRMRLTTVALQRKVTDETQTLTREEVAMTLTQILMDLAEIRRLERYMTYQLDELDRALAPTDSTLDKPRQSVEL